MCFVAIPASFPQTTSRNNSKRRSDHHQTTNFAVVIQITRLRYNHSIAVDIHVRGEHNFFVRLVCITD
jgi:hypothetical protein